MNLNWMSKSNVELDVGTRRLLMSRKLVAFLRVSHQGDRQTILLHKEQLVQLIETLQSYVEGMD
jgi:hypothetical protein